MFYQINDSGWVTAAGLNQSDEASEMLEDREVGFLVFNA